MTPEQAQRFGKFRERKQRIDKDVIRTDRCAIRGAAPSPVRETSV